MVLQSVCDIFDGTLTQRIEPGEVCKGVEVAGSASSTRRGPDPPVQGAVRQPSVWPVSTRHPPLLRQLRLDTGGGATLSEPYACSDDPLVLVGCWRNREARCGRSLVA